MPRPIRVLVIEDDLHQRDILCRLLAASPEARFEPFPASSLADADVALSTAHFDAILLDRVLPDGNGMDFLSDIRRKPGLREMPVLIVSGVKTKEEIASGLLRGADDYVPKPFDREVLCARLLAVLRRTSGAQDDILEKSDLRLDLSSGELRIDGRVEQLEPKETALLAFLLRRPNVVHSPAALTENGWGPNPPPRNTLEARMHSLRRKLGSRGAQLQTLRGRGYRFVI